LNLKYLKYVLASNEIYIISIALVTKRSSPSISSDLSGAMAQHVARLPEPSKRSSHVQTIYFISTALTPHSFAAHQQVMTTVKLDSHILEKDASTITEQLNMQSQQATARTLQALFHRSSTQLEPINYNPPIFLSQSLSIAPSDTDAAPQGVTDYLAKLVRAAQQTAESHYCGSFVAGQTSESDEFADIGVWLGKGSYQRNHEKEILDKLGLSAWTDAEVSVGVGVQDLDHHRI
jgi:hypothetical protein